MEYISYYNPFAENINIFHFEIEWEFLSIVNGLKLHERSMPERIPQERKESVGGGELGAWFTVSWARIESRAPSRDGPLAANRCH